MTLTLLSRLIDVSEISPEESVVLGGCQDLLLLQAVVAPEGFDVVPGKWIIYFSVKAFECVVFFWMNDCFSVKVFMVVLHFDSK